MATLIGAVMIIVGIVAVGHCLAVISYAHSSEAVTLDRLHEFARR